MKFIFSFLLLGSIHAREIISIHYPNGRKQDAEFVGHTLTNQLGIPIQLIHINPQACHTHLQQIAVICINENGSIEIKQIKVKIMQRMLSAFGNIRDVL